MEIIKHCNTIATQNVRGNGDICHYLSLARFRLMYVQWPRRVNQCANVNAISGGVSWN